MIAVGIARLQDGRVTPENVRPRAKNPIIAGFFREIGRADRLGSGVRNLYKYSKDYGGADPVFIEGNNFVISGSLKKLDSIRFPFGKQPIGDEKPHIETGKQPIGVQKQPIEPKKQPIEEVLLGLKLTRPTYANIVKLYNEFSDVEVFGRALVMKVCGLADGPAGIRVCTQYKLVDGKPIGLDKTFAEFEELFGEPIPGLSNNTGEPSEEGRQSEQIIQQQPIPRIIAYPA